MQRFWKEYPNIEKKLDRVNTQIQKSVKTRNKDFKAVIDPVINHSGKMLRAAFVLIGADFGQIDDDKLIALSSSIEMFHLATLIHDDIVDEAKLRRGIETVQSKMGKDYAVYTGDFILMRSMLLLSEFDLHKENTGKLLKSIDRVCQGEILQYTFRYSKEVTLIDYIRIISGKTAALFALSLFIGASEAGCSDKVSRLLEKIGYNIGVAFQIKDDLLDFTGTEEIVGKNTQADIIKGYYTLPIIMSLKSDFNGLVKKKLDEISNGIDTNLDELIKNEEAINETIIIFNRYIEKSISLINKLPNENQREKEILLDIVGKLIKRNY